MNTNKPAAQQNTPQTAADNETLLTTAQVRARLGRVSTMSLWRWARDPRVAFPAPDVVLNHRNYWRLGTLRRWEAERSAASVAA